jgi:hypothetical protein
VAPFPSGQQHLLLQSPYGTPPGYGGSGVQLPDGMVAIGRSALPPQQQPQQQAQQAQQPYLLQSQLSGQLARWPGGMPIPMVAAAAGPPPTAACSPAAAAPSYLGGLGDTVVNLPSGLAIPTLSEMADVSVGMGLLPSRGFSSCNDGLFDDDIGLMDASVLELLLDRSAFAMCMCRVTARILIWRGTLFLHTRAQ